MQVALFMVAGCGAAAPQVAPVTTLRVPENGLQPQIAVDATGVIHLIYYKGDPKAGDVFYVRSGDGGATFSLPLAVNSQAGSAIAVGNIRGAQLALGRNGRVYVAWNGSGTALPKGPINPALPADNPYRASAPMLYTRLNDAGTAFEPQRNLMQFTYALDGGGSVAADGEGNVYVVWHAAAQGGQGEEDRKVWIARSTDEGQTFAREAQAWEKPTGACACCLAKVFTDSKGTVYIIYRAAEQKVNRDMYLLTSHDHGQTFEGTMVDQWKVSMCPMSSESFSESPQGVLTAWETKGQVRAALVKTSRVVSAPGEARGRKHPVLASNAQGDFILAWTEGMGWSRGGVVAWQVFDKAGEPLPNAGGRKEGVPVWSLVSAFTRTDGGFTVVY